MSAHCSGEPFSIRETNGLLIYLLRETTDIKMQKHQIRKQKEEQEHKDRQAVIQEKERPEIGN